MARILITGARLLLTIDFLRQMARAGHRVWLVDSIRFPASAFSRYAEGYIRTPPPRKDPQGFIAALAAAMKDKKIDLLIPTYEEIFYISKYRDAFDNPDALFCTDFDILDRLHNKFSFATTLAHPDVQAPETFLLKTPDDIERFADRFDEFVFKPAYSRFGTRILVRPKPHEARTVRPHPNDPWIAQRFIEGTEFCSYNVAKNGKLTAHASYQPLYRLKNSAGFYFRPALDLRMMNFAKDIVAKHHYTGQISFDYIRQADGKI